MEKEKRIVEDDFLLLAFKAMMESTPDMIFIKTADLKYVTASRVLLEMWGCESVADVQGKTDYDFFEPRLAEKYVEDDRGVLESEVPLLDKIEPLPDKDGAKVYSATSKYCLKDGDGNVIGLYGIARDATAKIALKEERESRKLARKMFEGVLEADITDNRMLWADGAIWSELLESMRNSTYTEAVDIYAEKYVHPDNIEEFKNFYNVESIKNIYANGVREFSHLAYQDTDGNGYKWIEFKSRLFESSVTNALKITTILSNLDDEIRYKELLKKKAETDPLTRLLNRESVFEQINECITGSGAQQNHALLFMDLDNFKQVNDNMGHPFGDRVLEDVAFKLKSLFREDDIIGRVGGDEFLILLRNVTSRQDAEIRIKRIFEATHFCGTQDCDMMVECSVGVAMYMAEGKTMERLYSEADKAMYMAKQGGRNRIVFYDEAVDKKNA